MWQNLYSASNGGNISLGTENVLTTFGVSNSVSEENIHLEVSQSDSFRDSGHKPVAENSFFERMHKILSNLNRKMLLDPRNALENIHHKNINKLIFAQLKLYFLWNKFESLQQIINENTTKLMISAQFHLEGYVTPYRLDRNANGGNIPFYKR